ncbi:HipA N-terminal domain-containing protein [Dinghuibacter silviterrae]|uniref:Serine/threonine-protein kinase HipA n=1 Tax=Dinghuibacter silviterrae TaxID=1539049 RepID=A0A4R8DT05_9BACT|nr:HipA N-terminal domain-containing protein [Dinghuibacter silviterrae]TDX00537.1 serine/threonine-protein kinase HipA [Dinghuibacter silviterrae]
MSKTAKIYYRDSLAGWLAESDAGYEFIYDKKYLEAPGARPISLTLPIRAAKYHSYTLFAFFDGLIPEGWLLDIAKDHWKVKANDRFELLLLTCRDAIGAVSVIPVEENV